jgi:putative hemolysin
VDNVIGIVLARDLVGQIVAGNPLNIPAVLKQPLFIPEMTPVLRLLEMFRQSNVTIATVLDEFGGVQGLVTPSDIFWDLVGELPGRGGASPVESEIVARPEGGWLVDGAAPVEDLEKELGFVREDKREHDYRTVGGLVLTHLGHLPRIGEAVELSGFRFEVVDMDGRRIDRLLVTPAPGKRSGMQSGSPTV